MKEGILVFRLTDWHLKFPKLPVKDLGICPACDAQVVEQDEIFPTIPKPVWLGWWSLKHAPKRFQILVKDSEENFPFPPFACPW